jgi:hypothetical protein
MVVYNWTLEVGLFFASLIPIFMAFAINLKTYLQYRARAILWFSVYYLSLGVCNLLIGLSNLLLLLDVYSNVGYAIILSGGFLIMATDSLSRDSPDLKKWGIWIAISTILISSFYILDGYIAITSIIERPDGTFHLSTVEGPIFYQLTLLSSQFFISILSVYYCVQIKKEAPVYLQKTGILLLVGSVIASLSPIFLIIGLSELIPGIEQIPLGIGFLIVSYIMHKHPQFAFILKSKIYSVLIINNHSGINLYTHNFQKSNVIDDMVASLIQGLRQMAFGVIQLGDLDEIHLENGYLILQKREKFTVGIILTKTSDYIRKSLKDFSLDFEKTYAKEISFDDGDVSVYNSTSDLIEKHFSLVLSSNQLI